AFVAFVRERADALLVAADPYFDVRRDQIIGFAERQRLPAIYQFREYVLAGGLLSYGISLTELWALRRQQNDGGIGRHEEARGQVPAGLVDQEDGVGSGRDGCGDLGEVQVHRLGVAGRHDQGCTLALLRADCTEDVGGSGPLVPRCAWTGAVL